MKFKILYDIIEKIKTLKNIIIQKNYDDIFQNNCSSHDIKKIYFQKS